MTAGDAALWTGWLGIGSGLCGALSSLLFSMSYFTQKDASLKQDGVKILAALAKSLPSKDPSAIEQNADAIHAYILTHLTLANRRGFQWGMGFLLLSFLFLIAQGVVTLSAPVA